LDIVRWSLVVIKIILYFCRVKSLGHCSGAKYKKKNIWQNLLKTLNNNNNNCILLYYYLLMIFIKNKWLHTYAHTHTANLYTEYKSKEIEWHKGCLIISYSILVSYPLFYFFLPLPPISSQFLMFSLDNIPPPSPFLPSMHFPKVTLYQLIVHV